MSYFNYLDDRQITAIETLVTQAEAIDQTPPLSEHVLLHIRRGGDSEDLHFLLEEAERIIGYAHLDMTDEIEGPSAEVVVHPDFRSRGLGTQLMREVIAVAGPRLRLWSHGDLASASHLAKRLGFARIRTLLIMSRDLDLPIDEPIGLHVRTFLPGLDEESWLAANSRAFADHPEQGSWQSEDLLIRINEDWFDPFGFFIYEHENQIAGFCWTKIHGSDDHGHQRLGEIYVVGVDPALRTQGIGRSLTLAGLKYLQSQDAHEAILYVDSSNEAAVRLYEQLGFRTVGRDVLYRASLLDKEMDWDIRQRS